VLKTDYTRVSDALERSLHALHAAARASGGASSAAAPALEPKRPRLDADGGAVPMETGEAAQAPAATPLAAFAVIDEVSADSPAAAAGISVGDLLVALGDVRCGSGGAAAALAALGPQVAAAEGRALAVQVLRRGELAALSLTPRRWAGRGLLGCHLRPLS
jgi:26S proteasome non-ATPase regulatory subunit 9